MMTRRWRRRRVCLFVISYTRELRVSRRRRRFAGAERGSRPPPAVLRTSSSTPTRAHQPRRRDTFACTDYKCATGATSQPSPWRPSCYTPPPREFETTLHTWHFELALIASFPGLISGHQPGMSLEGHVRTMEFVVSSQIHEAHIEARPPGVINQGTYIVERMADWISGPHFAWR